MQTSIPLSRKLLVLLLFLCSLLKVNAQSSSIKGRVVDTAEKKGLHQAVVAILQQKDSVLVQFKRTNANGDFEFNQINEGKYLLLVSYPKFADYADTITLFPQQSASLASIALIRKTALLEEVVITQKLGAIRMKGDTLEFKADSFLVREGATVDALLKKLPGLQVNSKGEITAQGEKVQKILVDGEEFFSDDPAVVSQTLRANAVDKVQVFDKTSDQAAFTGIDDGEKTKTINLQLKENKKKGYFGKAKAGGGSPGWFENEAMVNAFKGKQKIAAYGTMANTGKAGLSWRDSDKFGTGTGVEYNEEEGYFFSTSENDEFNTWGGQYNGEGMPKAWTAGAHYSNKWHNDSNNMNLNYQFYKQDVALEGSNKSKNILPGREQFSVEDRVTFNQNQRHKINGFYDVKLDSSSSVKISFGGMQTDGISVSNYQIGTRNNNGNTINDGSRNLTSDGRRQGLNSAVIWRKKFAKKGRTISVSADQFYNNNNTEGLLQSSYRFYDVNTGLVTSIDTTDQKKINQSKSLGINSKIAYTEPLTKNIFAELNYAFVLSNSEALRNAYNKKNNTDPKYDQLAPAFSSNYAFKVNTHSTGVNFRYTKGKINTTIGSNIGVTSFRQTDLDKDTTSKRSFINFFPKASINYKIKPQTNLRISYNGATQQPTLEQIQPLIQNNDELNIVIGNPLLKQQFRHNFNINFNDYKVLSGRSVYVSSYINFVEDAISNRSEVDPATGKRVSQFININGNYNLGSWFGYWKQIKKLNINTGFNGNFNLGRYNNFVDGIKNTTNSSTISVSPSVNYDKENKFSLSIEPNIGYTIAKSSIQQSDTKFFTSESKGSGNLYITKRLELGTELTYNWRQQTQQLESLTVLKWDAFIAYEVIKSKKGEIRFSVFDLLNQNIGLTRNTFSNIISENSYNTIRRYWLLSFTWNFTKTPGTK